MIYSCRARVGMASVDAAGRIFYPELFRLAQECFESFLVHMDMALADWLSEGRYLLPVVHAEADYLHPIRLGDVLDVRLRVRRIGRTSFAFTCDFLRGESRPVARVQTVHVCIDTHTGNPVPLPDSLRERLAAWQET